MALKLLTCFNKINSVLQTNKNCHKLKLYSINIHTCRHLSNIYSSKNVDDEEINIVDKVESNLFRSNDINQNPVKDYELNKKIYENIAQKTSKNIRHAKTKFNKPQVNQVIIEDTNMGLSYIKLKLDDPFLSKLMLQARLKKDKKIIIEGRRLIQEALDAGLKLDTIIFSAKDQLELIKNKIQTLDNIKIVRVPQQNLRTWSTLTTCPGLIAILNKPFKPSNIINTDNLLPITIICDNIREPSNLGSIIRSCAAISCTQLIVTKGCCDPWDTKALRGGCGGQFYTKILDNIPWDEVNIHLPEDYSLFIAENNSNRINQIEEPIMEYLNMVPSKEHNVVIVGGETHGVSDEAYRLFSQTKSRSILNISMSKYIESLNAACAITLVLFEMQRKLLKKEEMN